MVPRCLAGTPSIAREDACAPRRNEGTRAVPRRTGEFMPYTPRVSWRGDAYIAGMGEDLAEGFKDFFKGIQENQFLEGTLKGIVADMKNRGMSVDPELLKKFPTGSIGAKRAVVSELGMMRQRMIEEQDPLRLAQLAQMQAGTEAERGKTAWYGQQRADAERKAQEASDLQKAVKLFGTVLQRTGGNMEQSVREVPGVLQSENVVGNLAALYKLRPQGLPAGQVTPVPGGGRIVHRGPEAPPIYEEPAKPPIEEPTELPATRVIGGQNYYWDKWKGAYVHVPQEATKATESSGEMVPAFYLNDQGQRVNIPGLFANRKSGAVQDMRGTEQRILGEYGGPEPGLKGTTLVKEKVPPGYLPLPKNQKDFKPGKYWWNGKGWIFDGEIVRPE